MDQNARGRPRVALLIPTARRSEVLTPAAMADLDASAQVRTIDGDTRALAEQLPALLADADACLTGWGSPPITEAALAAAPHLKLIAHCAGSVKRLIPPGVFERGITVSHAANIIADAVAEFTVLVMLLGLRRLPELDRSLRERGGWRDAATVAPRLLGAQTVGIVGAGYVGRKVIRLVRAFGPRVLVFDPYLPAETAASLGVETVPLADLFRDSDVVSLHLPPIPETRRMVGARELGSLRPGAILVNCGRSWTVDQDALLAVLRDGQIWAALDVFDEEPLPAASPFRDLPNVFLTPHVAGHTADTYLRQGQAMVDELRRFFAGQPLQYRIDPAAFALMA
jgi:phosphoglycerate dehydrogenase-like enzyme